MINSHVARKIATDLNVHPFSNESDHAYIHRLLLCALATWTRVLVLGQSISSSSAPEEEKLGYHAVDIMHVHSRLTQVAYGLMHTLPCNPKYVDGMEIREAAGKWASSMAEDLLFCYELARLTNRLVGVAPLRTLSLKTHQLLLGGSNWTNPQWNNVGIGRWLPPIAEERKMEGVSKLGLPSIATRDYYAALLKDAAWERMELPEAFSIFQAGSGGWHYRAWIGMSRQDVDKLPQGISLLRQSVGTGGFFLVRRRGRELSSARLDAWYVDENETNRLMYMLDDYHGRRATFKYKHCGDYIVLHCHSKLPNAEQRLLLLASWPYRTYNDRYYRIIPIFLWEEVQFWLAKLGVHVEETLKLTNGGNRDNG